MTPRQLAEDRMRLAAEYAAASEKLGFILADKPLTWAAIRASMQSDKAADRKWEESEEGRDEIVLRLRLKSIEKQMSAMKTMLEVMEGEARNNY